MKQPPESEPKPIEEYWRKQFENFASLRDDDAGIAGWSESGLQARLRHFTRSWKARSRGLWLDAGCGAGTYCRFLADHGQTVVGADYSLPSLLKARPRNPNGIHWIQADINHLPLPAGKLDGVLCYGVMQAISSSGPAIKELAAAVKPGGEVWVDALNSCSLLHVRVWIERRFFGKPPRVRYEHPRLLRKLLQEAGFDNVVVDWVPVFPMRWTRIRTLVESRLGVWLLKRVPGFGRLLSHSFVVHGRRRH